MSGTGLQRDFDKILKKTYLSKMYEMPKMIETTRMLIDPCEENRYSRESQAHVYSQIPGLGLSLRLTSDMVGEMFKWIWAWLLLVSCQFGVIGGFEPESYHAFTFLVGEDK